MGFEDDIKRAQEIKNQSNQATSVPNPTKQTINLGNGVPTNYERNKLGRPTNEGYEGDNITGEVLND